MDQCTEKTEYHATVKLHIICLSLAMAWPHQVMGSSNLWHWAGMPWLWVHCQVRGQRELRFRGMLRHLLIIKHSLSWDHS